jgi:hypothetical protein
MANRTSSKYRDPLDWFLDQEEYDYETRLTFLARQYAAEPFDASAFEKELVEKLERFRYRPPDRSAAAARSFHNILSNAGVLRALLDCDTLRDLWKCRQRVHSRYTRKWSGLINGFSMRWHGGAGGNRTHA